VPFLGTIQFREIRNISTGEVVPNRLNGVAVSQAHLDYTNPNVTAEITPPAQLPSDFDEQGYLKANPDVAAARIDPAKHYLEFGYKENRRWN
jgi:hypothetical protein